MSKPVPCPNCHRKNTYSEKNRQCSACGLGWEQQPERIQGVTRGLRPVTQNVTSRTLYPTEVEPVTESVTDGEYEYQAVPPSVTDEPIVQGRAMPTVTPGEPCPTCGRKVRLTGAQRMAALRDKERLKQEARAADG